MKKYIFQNIRKFKDKTPQPYRKNFGKDALVIIIVQIGLET